MCGALAQVVEHLLDRTLYHDANTSVSGLFGGDGLDFCDGLGDGGGAVFEVGDRVCGLLDHLVSQRGMSAIQLLFRGGTDDCGVS